jgi:hypothetical protein
VLLCAAMMTTSTAALAQGGVQTPTPAPFEKAEIRTPKAPATPRINGPDIFGVRPGNPFLYHIPATGERPDGLEQLECISRHGDG